MLQNTPMQLTPLQKSGRWFLLSPGAKHWPSKEVAKERGVVRTEVAFLSTTFVIVAVTSKVLVLSARFKLKTGHTFVSEEEYTIMRHSSTWRWCKSCSSMCILDSKPCSARNQIPDAQIHVIHGSWNSTGSFSKHFHTPHLSYKIRWGFTKWGILSAFSNWENAGSWEVSVHLQLKGRQAVRALFRHEKSFPTIKSGEGSLECPEGHAASPKLSYSRQALSHPGNLPPAASNQN